MIRLFIGLELPETVKDDLERLMNGLEGARWLKRNQLHLTLRFIGTVSEPVAEDLVAALRTLRFRPFSVGLRQVGIFGSKRRPRILWSGVREQDATQLKNLHGRIDRLLVGAGIEPDGRKFTPHVTLARFRGKAGNIGDYLAHYAGFHSEIFAANEIALIRSHLGHGGARHMIEETFPAVSDTMPV